MSGALPLFVFRLKMKNPDSSLFAEISSISRLRGELSFPTWRFSISYVGKWLVAIGVIGENQNNRISNL